MRVLVVYCHPVPESFCAAVRDAALDAIAAKGCEARLIDLYAENFDPVMRDGERREYNERAPADPALAHHIAHLKWAEAIVFVYPTWWYGLPAMLKGWLDRVWAKDVAFALDSGGRITPLMGHIRKIAVVTTCGAPRWWSHIVGHPGRKTILRGIRALCAKRCKTLFVAHYLMDASTPQSRQAFLGRVRQRLSAF
ncbi:MAG: NAD(P)H-dependent oxidoreductase [Aquamicrobium sp.]|uniref:NAD(P)H-dependent oxidoreductase n=1 Tax=Mesorhizobium sp. Pch-S TaxID=2082387 RepID=UPI0010128D2B|nr:NAD(P)H-dependent oxidoreductase [Mesorhizobium sp. Pch-S]MBR2688568.1 NAD(P)H-dependent oxidoreductase [Aquamicrobium sp.]QAZ45567.1 NAD(P)H dehydrogenase [Mesorhizobium sp. Pch-S]